MKTKKSVTLSYTGRIEINTFGIYVDNTRLCEVLREALGLNEDGRVDYIGDLSLVITDCASGPEIQVEGGHE